MFRKSALAMAMLGALATGNVAALGLGEIDLKSSLNQPLNAEINLLSATRSELDELKVSIASPKAFANAGIERPLFLTKFSFNVKTNAEGQPVVQVTSRDVVREPFLDFLLELSWSKGRLLREYTVLVDPPVTMPAAVPVPQAPAVQSAPLVPARAAAPAQRVTHTAQPRMSAAPGEYGPTRRHDTLWQIAQQVRPDNGVSVEQTMQGLLRANPEAFVDNNINNLKAGYILRVPDRESLTSMSRAEAASESQAQYAAWRAARDLPVATLADSAAQAPAAGAGMAAESHLQLVAPDSAEGAAGAGAEEGSLQGVQNDLLMANEALEAQRRQSEDMSERLSVLETQIQNMQRLVQLKDDELARLQAQVGEDGTELPAGQVEALDATADAADVLAETPVMEQAGEMGAEMPLPGSMDTVEPVEGMTDTEMPVTEVGMDGTETVDESMAEAPVEPAVEEPVTPVEPALVDTVTTPGFVDRLLANPLWLGAGGVVLALLAFFGLRRKRGVETEFQESILQAAHSESSASDSEIVGAEAESSQPASTESSLLSEFAVSDMGSIRNDGEADPMAEADVYLAYGRFQQAEDLIKDALEKDSDNENLNLKLLEVFLAAKNQSDFDGHAQAILARLENSDDPMWIRVAEMGRELNPDNPMYQEGHAVSVSADDSDDTVMMDSLSDDIEFDIAKLAAETEQSAEDEGLEFDIDLSFDAENTDEDKPDSVEFTPPEADAGQTDVSDPMPDIDMDSVEPDAVDTDNALDFDLEGLDMDSETAMDAEPAGDGELADLDEVSTKLDLARAYIDMGDPDGAKSILDEVMDEGSDEQKDEARGIMEQMVS